MIVCHVVEVIVPADVKGHSVLVQQQSAAPVSGTDSRSTVVNVDRMAKVILEEAADSPSAKGVTHEPSLRSQEGQFISYAEFIPVPVIISGGTV